MAANLEKSGSGCAALKQVRRPAEGRDKEFRQYSTEALLRGERPGCATLECVNLHRLCHAVPLATKSVFTLMKSRFCPTGKLQSVAMRMLSEVDPSKSTGSQIDYIDRKDPQRGHLRGRRPPHAVYSHHNSLE